MNYSMVIQWSDEDQTFVVILPEWADQYYTTIADGKTYEAAAARGRNALENCIQFARADGTPLPQPRIYSTGEERHWAGSCGNAEAGRECAALGER